MTIKLGEVPGPSCRFVSSRVVDDGNMHYLMASLGFQTGIDEARPMENGGQYFYNFERF